MTIKDLVERVDKEKYINGEFMEDRYQNVKGSPYNNTNFVIGNISMNNKYFFEEIPLRYNIYEDAIEFKRDNKVYIMPNPEAISKVNFNRQTYVYAPYKDNNHIKKTSFYFIKMGTYNF